VSKITRQAVVIARKPSLLKFALRFARINLLKSKRTDLASFNLIPRKPFKLTALGAEIFHHPFKIYYNFAAKDT
jgi:hypothetical protein